VEGDLGRVEGDHSGDVDLDGVDFAARPVVGPLLDVGFGDVLFAEVDLADAADLLVPGVFLGPSEER
jgi:hypothetical protein